MWYVRLVIIGFIVGKVYANLPNVILPNSCSSPIYCYGTLLHTVQLAKIFDDSKTFVDMKMKSNSLTTLLNFKLFMIKYHDSPTRDQVKTFVSENFEEGLELETWKLVDFNPNPKFLSQISDLNIKTFAQNLVQLWPNLARKVKSEIIKDSSQYSLIPVPNGFVVPGGRFKEFYYWDSYWIIRGLLISEMGQTVKGMIENFFHIVKIYGFVPNGGRIYYTNRSQPPLLAKMTLEYYKYSGDKAWLQKNIQYLDTELTYWLEKKTIDVEKDGKIHTMAHYSAESAGPRPESYLEDYNTVQIYHDQERQQQLYVDLKSAAESGWDFSSRWIVDEIGGNAANLSHIQTRRIIPVDLNSFLCEAFKIVSSLYEEIGNKARSSYWKRIADHWQKSIESVLWNSEDGTWYDYDVKLSNPRKFFYASNISPLWCGCFDEKNSNELSASTVNYLTKTGAVSTAGGIPTSLIHSGEQWDFPNAWPPLQDIVVQGLKRAGGPEALALAKVLAQQWVSANLKGYEQTKEMFEKYDATQAGRYGEGGEYNVQVGFGWTNGVALEFIKEYYVKNNTQIS